MITPKLTQFTKPSRGIRAAAPYVLVSNRTLLFNASAVREFGMEDGTFYELYCDVESKAIGVKKAAQRGISTYCLKAIDHRSARLHCSRFIKHVGVTDKSRFALHFDEQEQIIVGVLFDESEAGDE